MKSNYIYAAALALVLGATGALAAPGDGACEQHPNAPFCQGGGGGDGGGSNTNTNQQQQGQQQGQVSINVNQNESSSTSDSNAASRSNSDSRSNSSSTGGSVRNDVGIRTGPTNSSSNSSARGGDGGDARAYGGAAYAGPSTSEVGDTTAQVGNVRSNSGNNDTAQDVNVDASDSSVLIYEGNDVAAASAASVFAQQCQTGMSGQLEGGGFSVVNSDAFCDNVRAAQFMLSAYNWELKNGNATCADIEYGYTTPEGEDTVVESLQEVCINEQAEEYLESYRYHVDTATDLVRTTEYLSWADRAAGMLTRPAFLIGMLIFLL